LPEEDEPEDAVEADRSVQLAGDTFEITYEDSRGQVSVRRVSVRRVDRVGEHHVLKAYCFERDSLRSFRLDRVMSAVDLVTGEIFGEHQDLLEEILWDQQQEAESGFGEFVHDVRMLTYLAQCDGQFAASEMEEIIAYLNAAGFVSEREALTRHVQRLVPDMTAFEESLFATLDWPPERIARFADAAVEVVMADGRITPEETEGLQALRDSLAMMGIEMKAAGF
jgi:predicted DNA-binding transcriptional regulator YafY